MDRLTSLLPSHRRVPAVVIRSTRLSPGLQRIVLGGPDLARWLGQDGVAAPTAWLKVYPPGREGRAYTIVDADPRGGAFELLPDTCWLWIGADASALPAVRRILDVPRLRLNVFGVLVMPDERDRLPLRMHPEGLVWTGDYPEPPDVAPIAGASGQAWIAGEVAWVNRWKTYWRQYLDSSRIHAKGYWRTGGAL